MKKTILMAAAAAMTLAMTQDDKTKKEIVGLDPETSAVVYAFLLPGWAAAGAVARRFQPRRRVGRSGSRYTQRRTRSRAHTHPHDEVVTVIEGTWYLGEGERFDAAKLKGYPAGSFIVIPAGVAMVWRRRTAR